MKKIGGDCYMKKSYKYYYYDIDTIKKSLYLYITFSSKLSNYKLQTSDIHRIKAYIKDFKMMGFQIIKLYNNFNNDDYLNFMNSLIVINLSIQKILNKSIYRREKDIEDLEFECQKVGKLLGAESTLQLFIDNHKTAICMCIFITVILVCTIELLYYVYSLKSYDNESINMLIEVFIGIITLVVTIIVLLAIKPIMKQFSIDKQKRMLSNHTYIKSVKMKRIHHTTEKLFSNIKDK